MKRPVGDSQLLYIMLITCLIVLWAAAHMNPEAEATTSPLWLSYVKATVAIALNEKWKLEYT